MDPIQIAFFGATNSGKSTLVNAIAGQDVSLVSALPGTTTDPVRKRIELPGIGLCVLVDTAGYGDEGDLGAQRERLTKAVIDSTDVAVLLRSGHPADDEWESMIRKAALKLIVISSEVEKSHILELISDIVPKDDHKFLTGKLVAKGDLVVLVMPQDSEAPKGRLILPQVQVIRELLDRGCTPVCCTPDSLKSTIAGLKGAPALVITDSQVFKFVNETIPADWTLTSFSILLAAAKGDINVFVEGAKAINALKPGARVLIAEACTHVPDTEDIGRVKIPAMLRKRVPDLEAVIAAGNDFPEDLSHYSLIIHCGACVANAALVRSRIRKALLAGVPITNYGIAIAALQGILDRVSLP
ncbi:MAG: 50S ribosome-binding GTPase [Bacteroidales bacterium]|nr:50S ribosome-binding GTPase [Bacteroidales bacterium]